MNKINKKIGISIAITIPLFIFGMLLLMEFNLKNFNLVSFFFLILCGLIGIMIQKVIQNKFTSQEKE